MSLFESKINFEFVHAVQAIARELKELNTSLKEKKTEKPELTAHEKNLIWHEVEDRYNEEDAKNVAENLFKGTYLYDALTDSDWGDIVASFQDRHDMTQADLDQWEVVIEGVMFNKYIADFDDENGCPNWAGEPYVMCVGTEDDHISDLNEYFEHLKMNGYHFIRITDNVVIVDSDQFIETKSCAEDRNLAVTSCKIKLPDSWHSFSGIGLKQRCIDALLQSYTGYLDYTTEEEQQKILEGIKNSLSRCSREG